MADREYFELLWARIMANLENVLPGRCWLWIGGRTNPGGIPYGVISVKYPDAQSSVPVKAHRAAYMVKVETGPLPRDHDVSHLCGQSCCNPDHLASEPHHVNNNRLHCHANQRC